MHDVIDVETSLLALADSFNI